jgi:hypothetical protein
VDRHDRHGAPGDSTAPGSAIGGYLLAIAFHGAYDCTVSSAARFHEGHETLRTIMVTGPVLLTIAAFFVIRSMARTARDSMTPMPHAGRCARRRVAHRARRESRNTIAAIAPSRRRSRTARRDRRTFEAGPADQNAAQRPSRWRRRRTAYARRASTIGPPSRPRRRATRHRDHPPAHVAIPVRAHVADPDPREAGRHAGDAVRDPNGPISRSSPPATGLHRQRDTADATSASAASNRCRRDDMRRRIFRCNRHDHKYAREG